jgi:hypothetical protein
MQAIINLAPTAKRSKDLEDSMHKTFTDCYFADGFTGGGWNYAVNSNDADGEASSTDQNWLPEKDRRLAYYLIGWNGLAVRTCSTSRGRLRQVLTGALGTSCLCENCSVR